jgi:hypothetical protein
MKWKSVQVEKVPGLSSFAPVCHIHDQRNYLNKNCGLYHEGLVSELRRLQMFKKYCQFLIWASLDMDFAPRERRH